jgi:hypothetical protein
MGAASATISRTPVLQARWRIILALVLACFALAQNPATELFHHHSHSGDYSNGCLVCHAGHLPALEAAGVVFHAPLEAVWHSATENALVAISWAHSSGSSRAPPA